MPRTSITIKIRKDIINKLDTDKVESHLIRAIKRCPSCGNKQMKNTAPREQVSFRISPNVYREYEWVYQPYGRMAKIIEASEGVCLICGAITKK